MSVRICGALASGRIHADPREFVDFMQISDYQRAISLAGPSQFL